MLSNLHVIDTRPEINIQYTRYLINSVIQNGLGSINLNTIYHTLLDKLIHNIDPPTIYWSTPLNECSDPLDLMPLLEKYHKISFIIRPSEDIRLERLKTFLSCVGKDQIARMYINCSEISSTGLGSYLDSLNMSDQIVPVVLSDQSVVDSILYCKSAQKKCAVKFGLAQDWDFESIEMATACEIYPLIATDSNIVDLLHK